MPPKIDYTGQKFGKLTVIEWEKGKDKKSYWLCKCDCGNYTQSYTHALRSGRNKSCGCGEGYRKHAMCDTLAYKSWASMKQRCLNPNTKSYKKYGGRGIIICDRWKNSFKNFLEDMGERPKEMTIDRIDNDGNYEPSNCRWADKDTQLKNRSNTIILEYDGKQQSLKEWSDELNIPYKTLLARLRVHKWPVERVLTTPVRNKA